MIEQLKEIIVDGQESTVSTGTLRHLKITRVAGKATICIGVRRCGKSTYLYQLMQKLLDSGVSRSNILYLNFFDDRLHQLQYQGLNTLIEAYFSLYPEKKDSEKIYCFFDEIQAVPGLVRRCLFSIYSAPLRCISHPHQCQSEQAALREAMMELESVTGLIVTRNEEGTMKTEAGEITIIPLWRFLLYFTETFLQK